MALGVLANEITDPSISRVLGELTTVATFQPTELKGIASQWWALSDLNGRPFGCKPNALTAELSALSQFHRTGSGKRRQRTGQCRNAGLWVALPFPIRVSGRIFLVIS